MASNLRLASATIQRTYSTPAHEVSPQGLVADGAIVARAIIDKNGNIILAGDDLTPFTSTGATTIISAGAYTATLTFTGTTGVTFPTTGTLATLAGTETFTNKTLTSPVLTAPVLGVATGTSLAVSGLLKSSSATAGIGYATGAGGTVTQGTSRTTGVTLNTVCGNIVLFSDAGSATPFSFALTNSAIVAGDTVHISQKSGTDKYTTQVVTAVGAGSCQITLANASGTTTEQPIFNFAVIKGVAA